MKNRLVFLLSFLGLLVAGYLSYEYTQTSAITCPIGGFGCDTVRASVYSHFFGISTPLYGVFYYLFMMATSVIATSKEQSILFKVQLVAATSAVLFGLYLTYLEAFVIGAYCIWCLTSFIISIGILVILCQMKPKS